MSTTITTTDWVVGNPNDRSVTGFRIRHGSTRGPMSRTAYYRLKKAGRGPRETYISPQRIIITVKDERDWEKARAKPNDTEARLIAKLKAARHERAKKAGEASVKSGNHVSDQRRRSGATTK